MVVVELAVLVLPAVSEKTPLATETEPEPLWEFAVGVNTTVYTVEEVDVTDERVPPVTETSPAAKFEDASDSVIVNVEVCPDFNVEVPATIETTDGACVSYVIDVAKLAALVLPAASVNAPLATDTEPEPPCVFTVGVYTTVYDVPDTAVNDDNVPPVTVMSPTTKSVVDSDKVNVKVDV
jgi:hypothetical protein